MNGQETIDALKSIGDQIEELAAEAGFEDNESYQVEDAWVGVEQEIDSLRTTLEVQFEKVFERQARKNIAASPSL